MTTGTGYPRRTIITEAFSVERGVIQADEPGNPAGDVLWARTPAERAAEAQAEWDALDAKLQELEPLIGWSRMDDLLSRVNALQVAVRMEAFARMVAAAGDMLDYPIGIIVTAAVDEVGDEDEDEDEDGAQDAP